MARKASGGLMPHLFQSFGPVLMISMGYIDLGKWVAAVEGGTRFGFDLVLLILLINCTAILCQYLAACIGMVTGKNLAKICSEEYCSSACIVLGVQAELSMITSDLTMILGIAHGFNLLFGVNLYTCIFFATVGAVLLPFLVSLLDNCKAEALYIGIAGFTLLFYVLGVLISQPEIPVVMNGIFPRLSGESAYSLMALLGANIMVHNFYIHSSIIQQQRRLPNVAMGALFHDHFFAILFIFTGIFLVNYVLMNSAAAVFDGADVVVLTFQDLSLLMDQIFRSPVAPLVFLLVLFFASQVTTLTWNLGGQAVFGSLFGIDMSAWVHHLLVKALAIIPALCCVKSAGAEGIYQLLILCQVILAMLLPSSVIPLFRVASSRLIMGSFKISWYLEILALLAFFGMLASNIIFIVDMLFGNSSWIVNLGESIGSVVVPYTVILVIACASLGLTLYLAVTPLKSASDRPETQMYTWQPQKDQPELSEGREENDQNMIKYGEDQEFPAEAALEKSVESQFDDSILELNPDLPETVIDSDLNTNQSAHSFNLTTTCTSPASQPKESKSVEVDPTESASMVSVDDTSDAGILPKIETKDPIQKDVGVEADVHRDRNNEGAALEPESCRGTLPASTSEGPGSSCSAMGKGLDAINGSASLSKLSGLGRAARRQLAAVLDEFWGHLFDFHGQLTQEACTKRIDVLLGLDLKTIGSVKVDTTGSESSKSYFPDADGGPASPLKPRGYNSPKQNRISSAELSFGVERGLSSWSQNMKGLDTQVQSSSINLLEPNERCSSSLHLPHYSDNRDYQPATIHGYELASYLRGINAARNSNSLGISSDPSLTPKSAASFIPNCRDPVTYTRGQNGLGSLGTTGLQNPAASRISRLDVERPYYEPSFVGTAENVVSSAYTKKYYSLPDISGLIVSGRNLSSSNDRNVQWGGPIGPQPSLGRISYKHSQYLNPVSRAGVPLAFDELSPPKLHRDVFSLQSSLNPDTKSLWSRQPCEQLFGMNSKNQSGGDGVRNRLSVSPKETSYAESEAKLLQSLRFCILKLLKLEGSDWLFRQNGGSDEELIDRVAMAEKYLHGTDASEVNQVYMGEPQHLSSDRKLTSAQRSEEADLAYFLLAPNCGNGCIWRATLVVSFGVWCIHRILELSLAESRPELWGKYTYVLNRLQGILEPAFSKPRQPLPPCSCLEVPTNDTKSSNTSPDNGLLPNVGKPRQGSCTTTGIVLEIIKDVEAAVSGRKGRTGTAAGDVAFPKGKENLASVLKRYKRRLLNKYPGTHEGSSSSLSRKVPLPLTSLAL